MLTEAGYFRHFLVLINNTAPSKLPPTMRKIQFPPAIAAGMAFAASPLFAAPETYKIDPVHSTIGFKIRHLVGKCHRPFR